MDCHLYMMLFFRREGATMGIISGVGAIVIITVVVVVGAVSAIIAAVKDTLKDNDSEM